MTEYRIVRQGCFYKIQQQRQLLWWKYWADYTHLLDESLTALQMHVRGLNLLEQAAKRPEEVIE